MDSVKNNLYDLSSFLKFVFTTKCMLGLTNFIYSHYSNFQDFKIQRNLVYSVIVYLKYNMSVHLIHIVRNQMCSSQ